MDDPGDRRLGLPIRSVAVESLIKPMDRRMKRTEPFRKEGGRRPCCGASGVRERRRSGGALWVSAAAAPMGRWDRSPSPLICTDKNAIAPLRHPRPGWRSEPACPRHPLLQCVLVRARLGLVVAPCRAPMVFSGQLPCIPARRRPTSGFP